MLVLLVANRQGVEEYLNPSHTACLARGVSDLGGMEVCDPHRLVGNLLEELLTGLMLSLLPAGIHGIISQALSQSTFVRGGLQHC